MPSPVGHALGGLAAGCAVAPRVRWPALALFAIVGTLADVDFLLPLPHRGPSHSLTAAGLAFVVTLVVLMVSGKGKAGLRLAAAVGAAYLSHVFLDWLGEDSSSPRGVMALWPWSHAFYISTLDVFHSVNRRYWMPGFWTGNAIAVVRELAILGPVAWLVLKARGVDLRTGRNGRSPVRSYDRDGRRPPSV